MSKVFTRVGNVRPGYSVFDLSYEKKLTCDLGQLIPIMADEVVPGDRLKIGNEIVVRLQPLVAPIMHQVDIFVHYFFVAYRNLWDDWEEFITGGIDGPQVPEVGPVLPVWEPTNTAVGSLWDYFGFPTGVDPDGAYPLDFLRRAYNEIYNEYYRDETLQPEVLLSGETILRRNWQKDYFTSALLSPQRGQAPSMPLSGSASAHWPDAAFATSAAPNQIGFSFNTGDGKLYVPSGDPDAIVNARAFFANNSVALQGINTFNMNDLRLAFQIQKWMERNARAGVRYTEFLRSHFGVSPRDERLQRPEYIGGTRSPLIISEVLKTSEDGSQPQGNMAGHGMSVDRNFAASYTAQEFGVVIGLMSVMPRPVYQQGIDRQWLRRTRYDFYFPEFANLGEQAIERAEIFASGVAGENTTVFGYQGRYDEMRVKKNMICGMMRSTLDYWHMSRQFASAPELNSEFITCTPRKDVFAVQDEDPLIVNVANLIKAIRPLPIMSNPGMLDH